MEKLFVAEVKSCLPVEQPRAYVMEFEDSAYCSVFALGLMPRFCKLPMRARQTSFANNTWATHIRIRLIGYGLFSWTGTGESSEVSRERTAAEIMKNIRRKTNVFFAYDENSRQWLAKLGQPPISKPKTPPRLWPESVLTRTHVASIPEGYRNQKCRLPQGHDGFCQDFYSGSRYDGAEYDDSSDSEADSSSDGLKEGTCSCR